VSDGDESRGDESDVPPADDLVPLPDGQYEVFVIDCDEPDGDRRSMDLTIVSGAHKGEVLTIVAVGLEGDFTELIGMPGTVVVTEGRPTLTIES
jgi:hypothetical protein